VRAWPRSRSFSKGLWHLRNHGNHHDPPPRLVPGITAAIEWLSSIVSLSKMSETSRSLPASCRSAVHGIHKTASSLGINLESRLREDSRRQY
jgi:hypothetical protein